MRSNMPRAGRRRANRSAPCAAPSRRAVQQQHARLAEPDVAAVEREAQARRQIVDAEVDGLRVGCCLALCTAIRTVRRRVGASLRRGLRDFRLCVPTPAVASPRGSPAVWAARAGGGLVGLRSALQPAQSALRGAPVSSTARATACLSGSAASRASSARSCAAEGLVARRRRGMQHQHEFAAQAVGVRGQPGRQGVAAQSVCTDSNCLVSSRHSVTGVRRRPASSRQSAMRCGASYRMAVRIGGEALHGLHALAALGRQEAVEHKPWPPPRHWPR